MKKTKESVQNENSKSKILETATKLFAQNGFDGVSTRTICKQANINISMISYYFGGKQELYQAIIDNLIQNLTEYVKTFVDFDMDLNKLLELSLKGWATFSYRKDSPKKKFTKPYSLSNPKVIC